MDRGSSRGPDGKRRWFFGIAAAAVLGCVGAASTGCDKGAAAEEKVDAAASIQGVRATPAARDPDPRAAVPVPPADPRAPPNDMSPRESLGREIFFDTRLSDPPGT